MQLTGSGLNDNWNIRLSRADRIVGIIDESLGFSGEYPTRSRCVEMISNYSKEMAKGIDFNEIEIRYYVPTILDFGDFVVTGPDKKHTVRFYVPNDEYSIDDELKPSLASKTEYLAIAIPKGQKATIQAAADQDGESINGYVNKAILGRMGLQEWPDNEG